ncbi:Flagellar basal body rod protein FlgB (fragment), partial [Pseudomonas sp. JV551A1]
MPAFLFAWGGLFAGKPAPTGMASPSRTVHNPVGAGLPAKRPPQTTDTDVNFLFCRFCRPAIAAFAAQGGRPLPLFWHHSDSTSPCSPVFPGFLMVGTALAISCPT